MSKPYVIGIDLGGQTAKFGVVDARGNVLKQTAIRSNTQNNPEEFINDLAEGIKKLIENEYSSVDESRDSWWSSTSSRDRSRQDPWSAGWSPSCLPAP